VVHAGLAQMAEQSGRFACDRQGDRCPYPPLRARCT
jgi:hypothetical protein